MSLQDQIYLIDQFCKQPKAITNLANYYKQLDEPDKTDFVIALIGKVIVDHTLLELSLENPIDKNHQ